ncbi:MAG: hypothetical protein ABIN37_13335 [Burkholderiaceae bacterium]
MVVCEFPSFANTSQCEACRVGEAQEAAGQKRLLHQMLLDGVGGHIDIHRRDQPQQSWLVGFWRAAAVQARSSRRNLRSYHDVSAFTLQTGVKKLTWHASVH